MAKPIFTIGFPVEFSDETAKTFADKLTRELSSEYYVIFYQVEDKYPKFDMFSEHTIPKQDFKKLFSCIEEQMKKHKLNFLHSLKDEYS